MNRFIFPLIFLLINSVAFAQSSAFIYGGGDLCDNAGTIDMEISLTGTPPWNIVYAIDDMDIVNRHWLYFSSLDKNPRIQ